MYKAKFTIKDIKHYIEEKIGLIWKDNVVYDIASGEYLKATMNYFKSNSNLTFLYLNNPSNKLNYLVKVEVSNDKFIIWKGKTPIDVSREWINMLTSAKGVTL